jgi:hypothetical protein
VGKINKNVFGEAMPYVAQYHEVFFAQTLA